jgi:hypothetical protein
MMHTVQPQPQPQPQFPFRLTADSACILHAARGHSDALAEAALLRDLIMALTSDEAGMFNPIGQPEDV